MNTNLLHSEISSVTASRLGDKSTPESVSKTVQEYAKTCFDLIKEKGPTNEKDTLLVETPLVGYKIKFHNQGIKKNPDGSETKIGPNRTVVTALPNALLKCINSDLIKVVGQIASAVVDANAKKKAA